MTKGIVDLLRAVRLEGNYQARNPFGLSREKWFRLLAAGMFSVAYEELCETLKAGRPVQLQAGKVIDE